MKKLLFVIAGIAVCTGIMAQENSIKISGTRLAYPLFEKWVKEYSLTHKDVSFNINSSIPADSADFLIASYAVNLSEVKPAKQLIAVSRYVQLPVVNSSREDLSTLQEKGFSFETYRQVFFPGQEVNKPGIPPSPFTVYTREKPACATKAFAGHFGHREKDIQGVGVAGDDKALLDAVKKDRNAISYNNLGFIYNLDTRKANDSIAVIPIDFNGNGMIDPVENIYNTLDEVIAFAEKSNSDKLVIENVNVIVNREFTNAAAKDFLTWVVKQGQQYNHQTGFLKLRDSQVEDQSALLSSHFDGDILDEVYGKQH